MRPTPSFLLTVLLLTASCSSASEPSEPEQGLTTSSVTTQSASTTDSDGTPDPTETVSAENGPSENEASEASAATSTTMTTVPAETSTEPPTTPSTTIAAPATKSINIDRTVDLDYEAATPQQWSIKFGELRTAANPDGGYWILLNVAATYLGDNASGSFLDLTLQVTTATETVDWWFDACPQPPEPVLDLFVSVSAGETRSGVVCLETFDASGVSSVGVAGLIDEPVFIPVG